MCESQHFAIADLAELKRNTKYPAQAAETTTLCPNSTATPELIEILAARVVLRKSPPIRRIRIEARIPGTLRRGAGVFSIGSS